MMHSTVLLLSPLPDDFRVPDAVNRITAVSANNEARFILEASTGPGNGPLLFGSQHRKKKEEQVRNYLSLYIRQAHTNLAGLYENLDICIQIGHPGQIPDTYSIEDLYLNDTSAQGGKAIVFQAEAESFRFTIEKNNQMMISGNFWCTLIKDGKTLPASGVFKCWKV
jgi:hypothetical protein